MVSLYNRFDNVVAATEKDSEPVKVPLGKLVLKSERTLQLDMDSGSSFGIGEDVHSFAADENGVWYVTCRDYLRGNPWVYCVFFNAFKVNFQIAVAKIEFVIFHLVFFKQVDGFAHLHLAYFVRLIEHNSNKHQ